MSGDRVLMPLPDGRWLALSGEVFEASLRAGAEATANLDLQCATRSTGAVEPLLSADEAAEQLGVSGRWLEDSARAGIVPHFKLGGTRRFRVSEIADHFRVSGAPPPTDSESVAPFRRLSRQ